MREFIDVGDHAADQKKSNFYPTCLPDRLVSAEHSSMQVKGAVDDSITRVGVSSAVPDGGMMIGRAACLAYLAVTNAFAALRLLPMGDRDKEVEILALRHRIPVLERQFGADARARGRVLGAV